MTDESPDVQVIATGIKRGVKESRLRLTDRRVVFIAVFVVAFCLLSTLWQQHQTNEARHQTDLVRQQNVKIQQQNAQILKAQKAAYLVCEQTDIGNAKFNKVLDQLITNIHNSHALTPSQKAQALEAYASLHLTITDCSKLAGQ